MYFCCCFLKFIYELFPILIWLDFRLTIIEGDSASVVFFYSKSFFFSSFWIASFFGLHSHGVTWGSLTLDGCIHNFEPYLFLVAFSLNLTYLFFLWSSEVNCLSSLGVPVKLLVFGYVLFLFPSCYSCCLSINKKLPTKKRKEVAFQRYVSVKHFPLAPAAPCSPYLFSLSHFWVLSSPRIYLVLMLLFPKLCSNQPSLSFFSIFRAKPRTPKCMAREMLCRCMELRNYFTGQWLKTYYYKLSSDSILFDPK